MDKQRVASAKATGVFWRGFERTKVQRLKEPPVLSQFPPKAEGRSI